MAAKDDFDALGKMAEWLGLEADEAGKFIDTMMERKGHKRVSSWTDTEPSGDNQGDGNVFGIRKAGDKSKSSGANWQYGA